MKMFDYSELIRVIDNVEIREKQERDNNILKLKEECEELERSLIESGIFDDWYRLKQLCAKAGIRLCVSCVGDGSMGVVLGVGGYGYGSIYKDDGTIRKYMSSGSTWHDDYGFVYTPTEGIVWKVWHASNFHIFKGFSNDKSKYETKMDMLATFRDTYENYRKFQLQKIEEKFANRIKTEDIIK